MRRFTLSLAISGLLCFMATLPLRAQGGNDAIARAQDTLGSLIRLIDGIQAHQIQPRAIGGSQAVGPGSAHSEAVSLFDGVTLGNWKRTDFFGGGKVHIEPKFHGDAAAIVVEAGSSLSGLTWTGDVPHNNFEITLEAMKLDGEDFSCGLTFPVGDTNASLILGGWGGTVVGISSINDRDASENETTKFIKFPKEQWYRVRMRVTPGKLEAWLDGKQIVKADISGKKISLRYGEIVKSVPLGLATYQTTAAFRNIKLRQIASN